jgi:hypothetical protein
MLTNCEIITRAMDGIIAQGAKSQRDDPDTGIACVYRAENGLKCAAGHLIKDEHYDSKWNGYGCRSGYVREALYKSGVNVDDIMVMHLVGRLQDIHDNESISEWPERRAELLAQYKDT